MRNAFYIGETKLSLNGALLLFACLVLFILLIVFSIPMGEIEFALFLCFVLWVDCISFKCNLNLLFKTRKPGNFKTAFNLFFFSILTNNR